MPSCGVISNSGPPSRQQASDDTMDRCASDATTSECRLTFQTATIAAAFNRMLGRFRAIDRTVG